MIVKAAIIVINAMNVPIVLIVITVVDVSNAAIVNIAILLSMDNTITNVCVV